MNAARTLLALLLALAAGGAGVRAQPEEVGEYRVKAAFLHKFGGYVEWPADAFPEAASPLTIGVAGADELADELARVAPGHPIAGRTVEVRRLGFDDPLDGVHVLFVGRDGERRLTDLLQRAGSRPVLTVTESDAAAALGSMINFVVVDDRVRFDVALPPAARRTIRISSRLLAVARKVHVER